MNFSYIRMALACKSPEFEVILSHNKPGEQLAMPRSATPAAVKRLKAIRQTHRLPIVIFGNSGGGNFHPYILSNKRDPEQMRKLTLIAAEEFAMALELGGTLSGEYGIETLKRPYMEKELGEDSVGIQRKIKQVLDRLNILNP